MARSEVKKSQKYHTLFEIGVLFFALFFSLTTLSSFLYIVFPINAEQAAAYNFTKLDPADRQLEVQFKTKIYNDGFLSNIHSFANELILVNQDNARKAYKQFHARDMSFTGDEKHNLNAYVNNLFGSSGYPKNPEVEIVAHDHPDQLGVNLLEAITHDENGNKVFSFGTFQNEIYVSESFMIDYIVPFYLREKSISISDYEKQDYSYKYSHIATILDDENFLFPVRTSTPLALDPNLAAEYSYQTAPETD
ncbi:MAG: hypothetical protein LBR37_01170, partial [Erysipelotrichaceae bacterium]|nr:hypothetical protein [Erysipelotrichaceae bacterium]